MTSSSLRHGITTETNLLWNSVSAILASVILSIPSELAREHTACDADPHFRQINIGFLETAHGQQNPPPLELNERGMVLPASLIRFLLVGTANTTVGLAVIFIAKEIL